MISAEGLTGSVLNRERWPWPLEQSRPQRKRTVVRTRTKATGKLRRDRDEILDAVEAAQDALDEGQTDEAQDILDDIFDQYVVEESK